MRADDAVFYDIGVIQSYFNKKGGNTTKLLVTMKLSDGTLAEFVIYKNKNYAFDLIKNFESNKFSVGDTIDFEYNPPKGVNFPVIWRMYNHKRTRDES